MFDLTKDMDIKGFRFEIYDFFNKYGFGDGGRILEEEVEIAEYLCRKLAKAIGVVCNHWEPLVIHNGCHNPYYISFKDRQTGEIVSYYDMDEREKRRIEKRIEDLVEETDDSGKH